MEEFTLYGFLKINQGKYQYRIFPSKNGWRFVVVEYLSNKRLSSSDKYTTLQDVIQAIKEWIKFHDVPS